MKYMPIFMSVFMFFFLNSYPAGLNYYYFLSTLYSIVLTLLMKQFIDEDKILAQLEENKKKRRSNQDSWLVWQKHKNYRRSRPASRPKQMQNATIDNDLLRR